jgi:hypothetical protein
MNNSAPLSKHERLNEALLTYWQSKSMPLPKESDIQPSEIEALWPSCFLLNVEEKNFRYDFLGGDLIEAYALDGAQQNLCESLLYPDCPTLFNAIWEAIKTKQPTESDGEFINNAGIKICFRAIALPLCRDDSTKVSYILGGMRFKPYARYEKNSH